MARRTVNLTQNGLVVVVPESPERVDRQRLFQSYRVGNLRMAMEECHYPAGAGGPINEIRLPVQVGSGPNYQGTRR
jgi:hypothetical protein